MKYWIYVRAFFNTTSHNKVRDYAAETFPGLRLSVVGLSEKDNSQIEVTGSTLVEYADDKTALWESIKRLSRMGGRWDFHSGPGDSGVIIEALTTSSLYYPQLKWCHIAVNRADEADSATTDSLAN